MRRSQELVPASAWQQTTLHDYPGARTNPFVAVNRSKIYPIKCLLFITLFPQYIFCEFTKLTRRNNTGYDQFQDCNKVDAKLNNPCS